LVVVLAGVFSTVIGLCIAFGRLAPTGLVPAASPTYVELFRNIPLLLQILFWYFSAIALLPSVGESIRIGAILVNNRGIFLPRLTITPAATWAVAAAIVAFVVLTLLARRLLAAAMKRPGTCVPIVGELFALCFAPLLLLDAPLALDRPQ